MYYKTKLKLSEIKQFYICKLDSDHDTIKAGTFGVVAKPHQLEEGAGEGTDLERVIIVDFGSEDQTFFENDIEKLSFGTVEDPAKKENQKVAKLQDSRSVIDLLNYLQSQLDQIKNDPTYSVAITNELLATNLTRSIAALSIKLRLRGAEEMLQLMEKLLTTDPETKEIKS